MMLGRLLDWLCGNDFVGVWDIDYQFHYIRRNEVTRISKTNAESIWLTLKDGSTVWLEASHEMDEVKKIFRIR